MQTTRLAWKVLPMAQVAIFKEIFDQVRKDLGLWNYLISELIQRLTHYTIYLATDIGLHRVRK